MCKWGSTKKVYVRIPAGMSHTGSERKALKPIDACISDIVRALNRGQVYTIDSCCGHGKRDGRIILRDGRMLLVRESDFKTKENEIGEKSNG